MFKKTGSVDPAIAAAMMTMILSVLLVCMPGVSAFHHPPLSFHLNKARPGSGRPSSTTPLNGHMSGWGPATPNTEAPKPSDPAGATLTTLFLSPQHNPPFPSPALAEECPLHILDPHVHENENGYKLTFNLPDAVTEEGLDVSVSGRLLTIEARVANHDSSHQIKSTSAGDSSKNEGWVVTRSARPTHAAARSFVLPDGVSNQVTASWVADGKVEINLAKVFNGHAASGDKEHRYHAHISSHYAMEDWGGVPVERRCDDGEETSSGSERVRLSDVDRQRQERRSLLAVLDDEFRDVVRAMWTGDDAVRFPTEEQVAATVEKAREERKKMVTALRRATMATDVSENESAYIVRVALPEGATRDDVKLMVTPGNHSLRVTFFAEANRKVSKAVSLPWDALFSEISAALTPETSKKKRAGGGVSRLEVTVGRAAPQHPKSIDIK
ncbi:unnamed protein product [Scytosiphon promiscuus]